MSDFKFQILRHSEVDAKTWLDFWAARYPSTQDDLETYASLIANSSNLAKDDFIHMGKWKDGASGKGREGRWKENVASVAFLAWTELATRLPKCPSESEVAGFLETWKEFTYVDRFASGEKRKRFGLSRASTVLHFLSNGQYPILDSRVKTAYKLLHPSKKIKDDSVSDYLNVFCPWFSDLAQKCGTSTNLRRLDNALFAYSSVNQLMAPTAS